MRILHLADVHLDRPFVGLGGDGGRTARRRLRITLERCLNVARKQGADLVTIGGDLWEDEHVQKDTRDFVAHVLGKLELPVLIVCGNHDPYLPGGNYERTDWPPNVHLFDRAEPSKRQFGPVSIWGVSWRGGHLDAGFLERFRTPDDGQIHLLLLHGTSQPVTHLAAAAHCAFDPSRVREAGFSLCLSGHIHRASHRDGVVYSGSPEPLGWGETGEHCVGLVEVGHGPLQVELIPVNQHRYERRDVDCTGCESGAEVADRLSEKLTDERLEDVHVGIDLTGEVGRHCVIDSVDLATGHRDRYAELVVRNSTSSAYDLDALAPQPTATGHFVRMLRARIDAAADDRERATLELALTAGLRALDNREDVVHVDR